MISKLIKITKKHLKKIIVPASVVFFLVFIIPAPAKADIISSVVGSAIVGPIAYALLYLLQYVGGLLFMFGGFLASFALSFNFRILEANELVKVGWGIVRDVANLGFVLIIIVIAFATILRREQYGAKKLLPKLIAAAIIVNFSLVIAGFLIDFSHVLTRYFLKPIGDMNNPQEIVSAIGDAFDPQNLIVEPAEPPPFDPDEETGKFTKLTTGVLLSLATLVFTLIFTFTAAFVLIIFAFMLLLRYIWLSFLLILAPITWLFWVIPALSKQFSKWWNKFFEWVFFAPAVAFFLYLALRSIAVIGQGGGAVTAEQFFKGGALQAIMNQGVKMIILVGFLIGGLLAAKNIGITGAAGAIGLAKGVQKRAGKWAGERAKNVGRRAVTAGTDRTGKTALERFGASRAARIPLIGKAVTAISGVSSRTKASMTKNVETEQEKLKNRTKEDIVNLAKRAVTSTTVAGRTVTGAVLVTQPELAALALAIGEKGLWEKMTKDDPKAKNKFIQALRQTNSGKQMLAFAPDLATEFNEPKSGEAPDAFKQRVVGEAMSKNLQDATKLSEEQLKKPEITLNLKPSHTTQLGNSGTTEQKTTVKTRLETSMGVTNITNLNLAKIEMEKQTKAIADAQALGDAKAAKKAIDARNFARDKIKKIRAALTPEQTKALGVYESIQQNVSWQDTFPKTP
ncbi:MAG: hypothetical protein AAB935_01985 [Patescibacteria group bacterium]